MALALALALWGLWAAPGARAQPPRDPAAEAARQEQFTELLRTYPERPPEVTLGRVAALVDQGPFAERDRAIYWIGSARLALGDRGGARAWFVRLGREHTGSPWVERSWLGLADAAAMERRFAEALRWHARAQGARDPAVRELARLSAVNVRVLQWRQRAAWACTAFALAVVAWLFASALRARGAAALWPLPAEARIVLPVLGVLAVLALRQDPAPRGAVLELCAAGAVLALGSGARLRARAPGPRGRLLQAGLALAALLAWGYVAVWRGDLVGMVLETLRAGPE